MINKKSFIISAGFCVGSLAVIALAVGIKADDDDAANLLDVEIVEESTFENMNYFSLNEGQKVIALNASSLRIINQEDLFFTAPDGLLYNSKGEEVSYTATEGEFKAADRELSLTGEVRLRSKDGSYNAERLYYNGSKSFLRPAETLRPILSTKAQKIKWK